jgi:hypothetical protein
VKKIGGTFLLPVFSQTGFDGNWGKLLIKHLIFMKQFFLDATPLMPPRNPPQKLLPLQFVESRDESKN